MGVTLAADEGTSGWDECRSLRQDGFVLPTRQSRAESAFDATDLRAFDAQARHQALLVGNEGIGIVLQRGGRQVFGLALVHHHHGRPDSEFPALGLGKVIHSLVAHQKDHLRIRRGCPSVMIATCLRKSVWKGFRRA